MGCCGRKGRNRRKNRGSLGILLKRGGAHGDVSNGIVSDMLLRSTGLAGIPPVANTVGMISGLNAPAPDAEEIERMDRTPSEALLPGMSAYRTARRRKKLHELLANDKARSSSAIQLSELFGTPVAALGSAVAGAGIGDLIGRMKFKPEMFSGIQNENIRNSVRNSHLNRYRALGAVTGLSAPLLIAGLMALSTRRRNLETQSEYENDRYTPVKNMIIPGRGLYNYYKGVGATSHLSGKSDEELEEMKKKYKS